MTKEEILEEADEYIEAAYQGMRDAANLLLDDAPEELKELAGETENMLNDIEFLQSMSEKLKESWESEEEKAGK